MTELASKHAKARAPSTTHDSSAEWQRQESDEKGDVDEWEGDLLVLAVGNAQQAGDIACCPSHTYPHMTSQTLACDQANGHCILLSSINCKTVFMLFCCQLSSTLTVALFPMI